MMAFSSPIYAEGRAVMDVVNTCGRPSLSSFDHSSKKGIRAPTNPVPRSKAGSDGNWNVLRTRLGSAMGQRRRCAPEAMTSALPPRTDLPLPAPTEAMDHLRRSTWAEIKEAQLERP